MKTEFKKNNEEIKSIEDWGKYASPKGKDVHWVKGRSAYSMAEFAIKHNDKFNEVMEWATHAIQQIESYDVLDWMECKVQKTPGKPDMFCASICGTRAHCPNSITR